MAASTSDKPMRQQVEEYISKLQDEIVAAFEAAEKYRMDKALWQLRCRLMELREVSNRAPGEADDAQMVGGPTIRRRRVFPFGMQEDRERDSDAPGPTARGPVGGGGPQAHAHARGQGLGFGASAGGPSGQGLGHAPLHQPPSPLGPGDFPTMFTARRQRNRARGSRIARDDDGGGPSGLFFGAFRIGRRAPPRNMGDFVVRGSACWCGTLNC